MFPFRRNVLAFAALLALSSPVLAGKLAIVIDDFGYRPHNENQVLAMPSAISVAVLPDSPHAREMATKAHNSGHEVLIHLPMAPLSKQPLEKNTLRPEMSSDEIERIIRSAVNNVPYAVGINNHMGSKMTSNLFGMQKVMQALERYNLYFLDSVTIGNTQAMRAAQGTGVKVIKRKDVYKRQTLRRNVEDLSEVALRQRILKNMSDLSLETTLFNEKLSMPVALAPVGLCGMYARRGEVQAAKAADAHGIPFTLSTVSVCPIEEVAPAIKRPMWFQLNVLRDRGFMRNALERAKDVYKRQQWCIHGSSWHRDHQQNHQR